ncbi:Mrx21p [Ascoidea rubescens DSM 1968]|uniref:Mitochondrial carrier n=1 Tax=Ascoidea rubescens DSM 1968 TaxID=1344418 RepID=A0A1D2VMS0_9ASCO|nr:mitochondrial carrier [Ascoidea rubescens DSM 1968]ODV62900.1 mitochondrial carrier [Ascoidea rubescens DSM 1968]
MSELLPSIDQTKKFLKQDLVASFIAGGFAGAISRTIVSPFERAKIIFQIQGPGKGNYKGIFPTIFNMWKEEGVIGLFRGNGINCIRIFPYQAVQFYVFQNLKLNFFLKSGNSEEKELKNIDRLIAGGVAGIVSVYVTYPMDLIRTRLSIQTAQNLSNLSKNKIRISSSQNPPGFWQLFIKTYKTEGGVLGLYRGVLPTTVGVAPYVALNFAIFEQLKEILPDSSAFSKLLMGAIAGGVSQTAIYPFDLLRRRFQVLAMGNNEMGFKYTSIFDALMTIGKKEGWRGYYKGLSANLFKVVPSMAVSWLSFEVIKDCLVIQL